MSGIGDHSFVNAIREDTQNKGLLFAGTELGIYVSFDDGDHWQPLQLNLPVTSVRDITIHGDDLVIATYGRSFWIMDDITPLRQINQQTQTASATLYKPATAIRIDNDVFLGSAAAAGGTDRARIRPTAPSSTTTCPQPRKR